MRILILTQVMVYPPDAGPKIKTFQVLQHLARKHTVVYCTFIRINKEREESQKLRQFCSRVVTVPLKRSHLKNVPFFIESLATGDSFLLRRDERAAMRAMVSRLLDEQQIDILHVDQLNMMRFVPPHWPGIVILDEHNAVWQVVERLRHGAHQPLMRWFLGRETRLLRRLEGQACQRASIVLAVSEQDRQALQEVAGNAVPIEVVPIAVDVTTYTSIRAARSPQPGKLLTIGTMFWPPNSEGVGWWLREGYEHLHATQPHATYDIVGARPPRALQMLARSHLGVYLHGYIADAVPFWTHAAALAVPLLSGGSVRVKILEAMAMGVPIISTTVGCEGLDVQHGVHLLIADTPLAFSSACAAVLQDQQLAQRLAQNAYQLLLERYDTNVSLQLLDTVYKKLE